MAMYEDMIEATLTQNLETAQIWTRGRKGAWKDELTKAKVGTTAGRTSLVGGWWFWLGPSLRYLARHPSRNVHWQCRSATLRGRRALTILIWEATVQRWLGSHGGCDAQQEKLLGEGRRGFESEKNLGSMLGEEGLVAGKHKRMKSHWEWHTNIQWRRTHRLQLCGTRAGQGQKAMPCLQRLKIGYNIGGSKYKLL
jgi:hypothetical protein